MLAAAVEWLLAVLAVPSVGLGSVFVISFLSATLLPMGSEPAVFAVVKANASLFWPVIGVATLGNTLGGVISYGMGAGAKRMFARERSTFWFHWLQRYGPKAMLMAWLPGIGDPLCLLGGWLRLPFWPCVVYMAIGKLLRYLSMTILLLYVPDDFWRWIGRLF
ncbi:YqaA family protein [Lacisediminimonas sp.]|uniref:YqaA family protein n=1 Tax=Lacisediminimonas sp. TaxID=3060582 RepID=UPI00271B66FF|nr:YqaA family protein [Lacisediminimonas sp.]MDO8298667.1 YqaA family protein [Lacisediminimonas sp.]